MTIKIELDIRSSRDIRIHTAYADVDRVPAITSEYHYHTTKFLVFDVQLWKGTWDGEGDAPYAVVVLREQP